jgi:hypothetical protein
VPRTVLAAEQEDAGALEGRKGRWRKQHEGRKEDEVYKGRNHGYKGRKGGMISKKEGYQGRKEGCQGRKK